MLNATAYLVIISGFTIDFLSPVPNHLKTESCHSPYRYQVDIAQACQ